MIIKAGFKLITDTFGMVKTGFFLLVLFFSSPCFSQFTDTTHHQFRFAASGIINKTDDGNSYVFSNGLAFNTKEKKIASNISLNWIYGYQNDELSNNDFSAHGDVDFLKGISKLYYWSLLNYDKSFSLKINDRLQTGAGIGYNFIDSSYLRINISDGILYEYSSINDPTGMHIEYNTARNSFRLLYHWSIKNILIIDGIHFYQPSFLAISDYIIESKNNISIKLKKWLSITASLVYNRVNRTERDNLLMTYGVTIEKYF